MNLIIRSTFLPRLLGVLVSAVDVPKWELMETAEGRMHA